MQQNQYFMMGAQFEGTSGAALTLKDVNWGFDLTKVPAFDSKKAYQATAPQIQLALPDRSGTEAYYYASRVVSGVKNYYWFSSANKLSDSVTIDPGLGFWYRDPSDAPSYTFSGQIMPDSPWSKTFDPGIYRMLVCPYPKQLTLADLSFSNAQETAPVFDSGKAYQATAMQIQIPLSDRTGFEAYYYASRVVSGVKNYYWFNSANKVVKDPTTVSIPVGRGAWFRPANTSGATAVTVSISL